MTATGSRQTNRPTNGQNDRKPEKPLQKNAKKMYTKPPKEILCICSQEYGIVYRAREIQMHYTNGITIHTVRR